MLVLERRPKESIDIDGPATIKVLKLSRRSVSIGIHAPGSTKILRSELTAVSQQDAASKSEGPGNVA